MSRQHPAAIVTASGPPLAPRQSRSAAGERIESALYENERRLFGLPQTMVLYDLTGVYFERASTEKRFTVQDGQVAP